MPTAGWPHEYATVVHLHTKQTGFDGEYSRVHEAIARITHSEGLTAVPLSVSHFCGFCVSMVQVKRAQ